MSAQVNPGDVLYDDSKENNSIYITLLETNDIEVSLVDLSNGIKKNIIAKPNSVIPPTINKNMSREELFDAIYEGFEAEFSIQRKKQKEQLKNNQIEKLKN